MDDGLIEALVAEGAGIADEVLTTRCAAVAPQDPATIVYTSGTTGRPKGCVITHENLMFVARTLVAGTGPVVSTPGARTVLFLPLAHVLGRGAQVFSAEGGMQVAHCPNAKLLPGDMLSFRPTYLVGVPRIFEKIFNAAQQKAYEGGKARIFDRATAVAIDYGRATLGRRALPAAEGSARPVRPAGLRQAARRAGRRAALRDHRRAPASARGSATSTAGIGLTVMEGYGLTETDRLRHVQPRRGAADRLRRPAHAGHDASGSPTTARSGCAGPT